MTLARRDVRATAASGVWRSPQPLPLAFLAATVNSCASGTVYVWWSAPVSALPSTVPPDAALAPGQPATFAPGLLAYHTLYLADSGGGALDVLVAADVEAITAIPGTGAVFSAARVAATAIPLYTHPGNAVGVTVKIPPGIVALGVVSTAPGAACYVSGKVTGLEYLNTGPGGSSLLYPALVGDPLGVPNAAAAYKSGSFLLHPADTAVYFMWDDVSAGSTVAYLVGYYVLVDGLALVVINAWLLMHRERREWLEAAREMR